MDKAVVRLNELFGQELGRNHADWPIYAWAWIPDLTHLRAVRPDGSSAFGWKFIQLKAPPKTGSDIALPAGSPLAPGLWIPERPYETVRSFPYLGDRWCVAKCEFLDDRRWHRLFGSLAVWRPGGYYIPTDVVLKPGFRPTEHQTWYWIYEIRRTLSRPAEEYEQMIEAEMERSERANLRTLTDMVEDACTAHGNKPGSRSGGVSFPGVPTKKEVTCP